MEDQEESREQLGFLNILILILSVYVLIALFVDTYVELPQETSELLYYIDNLICIVFLIDFWVRFRKAESKLNFMKWGWIDLIASVPTFDFMRAGRLLRLIRIIRLVRAFRSTRHIVQHVFKNKIQGTLTSVSLIAILMLMFASIAILQVETDPQSNIRTAEDAIWWSYATITTVGYGDRYPVTTEGRIIAMVLMTVGAALFGTFTAYISSWFIRSDSNSEKPADSNN